MDAHRGSLSPVSDPIHPPVLGVDGRRGRWCGALLAGDGRVSYLDLSDAEAVGAAADDAGVAVVGIDIPLGLPERGRRSCDTAARALLRPGRAGSRMFTAPPRPALDCLTHAEASKLARQLSGSGMSIQTWCLRAAIASGAELAGDRRVIEVHPEVSFLVMTGRVLPRKRTAEGRTTRLAALSRALPGLDPGGVPGHDDAIDALACAWTARRWTARTATVLGGEPDASGRPMRIVA